MSVEVAIAIVLVGGALLVGSIVAAAIRRKNIHYWLRSYCVPATPREVIDTSQPVEVFISVCDHWEPHSNQAPYATAMAKVDRWVRDYPRIYGNFRDSSGRPPQHTFFFPLEDYRPEYMDRLAELRRQGLGDVDVHLHHDGDTPAALEDKLDGFRQTLFHRHGLLRRDPRTGEIVYGFIHGNWALCNARPDGRWCGVDQELAVLRKTGCYADFTMPSAPSDTQTSMINSIYYAKDIPGRRKSHNFGTLARVGQPPPSDHLLMIQGPLSLDWHRRRRGLIPRIENGDVTERELPSMDRWQQWMRHAVHVAGQPNWRFVKLHTHGCKDGNIDAWLGSPMLQFHRDLADLARCDQNLRYHYVTAWEMAELVHQAEAGVVVPSIGGDVQPVIGPDGRAVRG